MRGVGGVVCVVRDVRWVHYALLSVLEVTESWAGPGYETKKLPSPCNSTWASGIWYILIKVITSCENPL